MPYDAKLARRIHSVLAQTKGVTEKKMFGCVGYLLNDHVLVGVWGDSLIVRVGPKVYEEALREFDVREFDITGRPMRGWIAVGPAGISDDDELKCWVDTAIKFVRTLPAK